jgi:hypothetical protein
MSCTYTDDINTKRLSYGKMKNYVILDLISNHVDIDNIDGYSQKDSVPVSIKDNMIFEHGKGYLDDFKNVWIYYDHIPNIKGIIPWFNISDGKLTFGCSPSADVKEAFSEKNVRDISIEKIIETTKENEDLYDEEELKFMNSATSSYTPDIDDEKDDFLKKCVKKILLVLNININKFTPQFKEKYTLSNLKTALQHSTKMSVKSFSMWMELLGCDFIIVIKKSPSINQSDGLKGSIIYDSETNTIKHIDDDIKL